MFAFPSRAGAVLLLVAAAATSGANAAFASPQPARSADAFVHAIGVNTHFGNSIYPENGYANREIGAKLAALGVKHIRDHSYNDAGVKAVAELHRRHGIRAMLVLGETTRSPADVAKLLRANPAYEAVEGLNEPDFTTRTYRELSDDRKRNDYSATRAFQDELYAAVKADPKLASLPVLSPAMGRSNRSSQLIPIRFDIAALHRYAWEGKTALEPSAGLDEAIANIAPLRGDKPLWTTETGYYNHPADHARSVPEHVAAKYVPRLVAEFFNRGVERTYLYELADQGPDRAAREQNFGLLRHDMTEKPAYVALRNLITLLREPQPRQFTPATFDFTLNPEADTPSLHHTILQKSDGRFYLLLWLEQLSYDAAAKTDLPVAPCGVTLTLAKPMNVKTYLPNDSAQPLETHPAATKLKLTVPDHVMVVELAPAAE